MTHATFPRIYIRKGDGPIIEYMRGLYVPDGHLMQLSAQFGSEWRVWQELWGRNAVGAHQARTRPLQVRSVALTREEMRAMEQDEYPFEQGSRFAPNKPAEVAV